MSAGVVLLGFVLVLAAAVARDYMRMYRRPSRAATRIGIVTPPVGKTRGRSGLAARNGIARPRRTPERQDAAQERLARSTLRTGSADVIPYGCAGPVTQPTLEQELEALL